ncbi:MAG: hypothetical protein GKR91_05900 [Pseudomonadales bacterium]|nr:hypothetical protein [Pseudomonadales bacterium]
MCLIGNFKVSTENNLIESIPAQKVDAPIGRIESDAYASCCQNLEVDPTLLILDGVGS